MSQGHSMTVTNGSLHVGSIRMLGITSSSALLIGDTESLTLYSFFDTPPESVLVGPLVPLPELPEQDADVE